MKQTLYTYLLHERVQLLDRDGRREAAPLLHLHHGAVRVALLRGLVYQAWGYHVHVKGGWVDD